jgi:hypothetical protein
VRALRSRDSRRRSASRRRRAAPRRGRVELGDPGRWDPRGHRVAHRAERIARQRELGRDHHRDARRRQREQPLGLGDPRLERGHAPHDADRELAALARRAGPRAQLVALDDLDEITLEDAQDFRRPGHCNHRNRRVSS